jgi:nitroreductase
VSDEPRGTRTGPGPIATAIAAKRAVRRFADRPLPDEAIAAIVDAGRHAGSSKNTQPWTFIVVRDRERLQELGSVGNWAGHLARAAVGIALVTPDPATAEAPLSVYWDLGQAAQNMMLAAWELGIGSVPATVYDQALARRILGYPDDRHCEFLLSFGFPADPADMTRAPKAGGRRALDEVRRDERW